jgi:hypothetical protein
VIRRLEYDMEHFWKLCGNDFLTRYLDTCAFVVTGNWDAFALVIGGGR